MEILLTAERDTSKLLLKLSDSALTPQWLLSIFSKGGGEAYDL